MSDHPGWTLETQRELLEMRLAHERELREMQISYEEKARVIQATEYARRLDVLNHAHEEAAANWARTLPREMFDSWVKDFDKWRGEVMTRAALSSLESEVRGHTQALNRFQGATWLLGFGGFAGVIALLLALLRMAGLVT
jgi:predicted Ser/Thr protein kinase